MKALKNELTQLDLDFIFFQEIRGHYKTPIETEITNHPEEFADSLWPHFAYGKNSIYKKGHHGNAIFSKYPIQSWKNYDLSTNPLEKRGLLQVEIHTKKKKIILFNTHLNIIGNGKKKQISKIIEIIKKDPTLSTPFVLAGDFNDWNGKVKKQIEQEITQSNFDLKKTFPSWFPIMQLDQVFLHDLELISYNVLNEPIWKKISDHLPILVEFK